MAEGERENSVVGSEIEVLQSIYLDELHVSQDSSSLHLWEISLTLHPATADDAESQYVRFNLNLSLTAQYPDAAPVISIRNPRGLSDDRIQSIYESLTELAEAGVGGPVLYQLIEKGKEILTNNNVPHCQCVICLDCFQENEDFTKTGCYHYFHSHCLARYIEHTERELHDQPGDNQLVKVLEHEREVGVLCPVCREPLTYDLSLLLAATEPNRPLEPYQPDESLLKKRQELQLIFQRQQGKGGIIDPEAERNRFFISLSRPGIPPSSEDEQGERSETCPRASLSSEPEPPPSDAPAPARPERRERPTGRGWAETRRRPRAPGDHREGDRAAPAQHRHGHTGKEDSPGPPREPRLSDTTLPGRRMEPAPQARWSPGLRAEWAPERGTGERRGGPQAQERRPWPRKAWPGSKQDWSKGRGHPRGRGSGRARSSGNHGPRDMESGTPCPGEGR